MIKAFLALALAFGAPAAASDFLAGVNYPWSNYGWDFGDNAWGHKGVSEPSSRAAVEADFAFLKSKGVKVARWFVFCDGRASPEFGADGAVTGFDPHFFADLDAALAARLEVDPPRAGRRCAVRSERAEDRAPTSTADRSEIAEAVTPR